MSTWKMASWFAAKRHSVAIYSSVSSGHKQQEFAQLYCGVEAVGGFSPASEASLVRALRQHAPDIVINQMPYESRIGKLLSRERNVVLLACLRNTLYAVRQNIADYGRKILPRGLKAFANFALVQRFLQGYHRVRHRRDLLRILGTYDRFVMFGPPNLDELRYFVPDFQTSKVALIPNSVPSVERRVPRKANRLLWLGRIDRNQKQVELVVPLWERLCSELPDWHFDVVGDGPDRPWLEKEITKRGLARIELHGRQVPDGYYRRSPVFVMTSAWEGFPNTIVEAQSFGAVPVLFDSFPVAGWMVSDSENGILVNGLDIDKMADEILSL